MDNNICTLCPRECKVNRKEGKSGYCNVSGEEAYVSMASLHLWEEPYISGTPEMQKDPDCPVNGSGTIFFAGCNMHCVYCQNYEISKKPTGKPYSVEQLAKLMLELQERGAANINLVTPTHYTLEIIEAVKLARTGVKYKADLTSTPDSNVEQTKLRIPIVYNCSGYEKVETLKLLDGGDRIDAHQCVNGNSVPLHAGGLAEGIYDRRRVHPELNDETEKDLQVAVFRGKGRDYGAET